MSQINNVNGLQIEHLAFLYNITNLIYKINLIYELKYVL